MKIPVALDSDGTIDSQPFGSRLMLPENSRNVESVDFFVHTQGKGRHGNMKSCRYHYAIFDNIPCL